MNNNGEVAEWLKAAALKAADHASGPWVRILPSPHNGVLAQLVRVPDCHSGDHGFESRTYRKNTKAG